MKAIIALVAFLIFSALFLSSKIAYATIVFNISNPVVNSDDSIDVDTSITGLISSSCSSSGCYLQAELRTLDNSKGYFGYTYNNSGEFVDYFSPVSSIDEIKTKFFNFVPVSGAWSGKLKAKNNVNDPNYLGPGEYTLKFRRFSGNTTTPTTGDSNALVVNLALATPTPTPTPTPAPTDTPTSTEVPTEASVPTKTPTPTPTKSPTPKPVVPVASMSRDNESSEEAVLGESSESASMSSENNNSASQNPKKDKIVLSSREDNIGKLLLILGFVFILACGILFSWSYIKKKKEQNE